MEAISVVKNLYEDVHKWKKAAEESKVLAVEASEQIRLLKEHRDETSSVLSDQEKQIATLEAVCMASQARIFRDLTKIRKLERDLKLASRNALEEFKKSSALSLYKAAIAKYKASGAFQNELDRAMKQLQDSSMTRARGEGELREIISRIVEDVHLQCPHIDFLKVREIGAFGEYHLAVTGKRKPDIPESSAGEGSSSKKHHQDGFRNSLVLNSFMLFPFSHVS